MNILILGATSGMAHEAARVWARQGASLFLVARSTEKMAAVAKDLRVLGAARVEEIAADLADVQTHERVLATAFASGPIEIALLAYGILGDQDRAETDVAHTLEIAHVNYTSATALLTRLALRLEPQGRGAIVVLSSVAGDRGRRKNYVYGASKAALTAFTSGLRGKLWNSGVRVVTIKPGFIATPMIAHLPPSPLIASAQAAGQRIAALASTGQGEYYVPRFWGLILFILRHLPEGIFQKLKF